MKRFLVHVAVLVGLALACVLTWFPTWDEPYAEDDYLFLDATSDLDARGALQYFTHEGVMDHHYRPLSDPLFFVGLRFLAGTDAVAYHACLTALHLASAFLVYLLFVRLRFGRFAAALAALLYVTRDFTFPSMVWASGVSDIGSGFFVFLSLLAMAEHVVTGRWVWRLASLVAFVGALLVKETAVVSLGLLTLVVLHLRTASAGTARSGTAILLRTLWPFVAVAAPITILQARFADFESAGRQLYALGLSPHLLKAWPAYLAWSLAGVRELFDRQGAMIATMVAAYAALVVALVAALERRASSKRPSPARARTLFVVLWFFISMLPALLAPHRVLTNYLVVGGAGIAAGVGALLAALAGDRRGKAWHVRFALSGVVAVACVVAGPILVRAKDLGRLQTGGWVSVVKARQMHHMLETLRAETLPEPDLGSSLVIFGSFPYDVRVLGDPRREGFAPRQVLPSAVRVTYARTDLDALSLPSISACPPDLMQFVERLVEGEHVHVVRADEKLVDVTLPVRRLAAEGVDAETLRRAIARGR